MVWEAGSDIEFSVYVVLGRRRRRKQDWVKEEIIWHSVLVPEGTVKLRRLVRIDLCWAKMSEALYPHLDESLDTGCLEGTLGKMVSSLLLRLCCLKAIC